MKRFDYYRPESLEEAFALKEKFGDGAGYIAGGTDILVRIKQKALQPDALISLRAVASLKGIDHNGGLSLGSMTPLRDIAGDPSQYFICRNRGFSLLAQPRHRPPGRPKELEGEAASAHGNY